MNEFCIAPMSTVTARQILKAKIRTMQITDQEPTIINAIRLANDLNKDYGLYVNTNYLLSIWTDLFKEC